MSTKILPCKKQNREKKEQGMRTQAYHHGLHLGLDTPVLGELAEGIDGLVAYALRSV